MEAVGLVFFRKGPTADRLSEFKNCDRCEVQAELIFVTVGNATQGFKRLLNAVDELATKGFFRGDEVVIQVGNNLGFQASNCRQEAFLSMEQFSAMILKADLVISHAGAGTLFQFFEKGKFPWLCPAEGNMVNLLMTIKWS